MARAIDKRIMLDLNRSEENRSGNRPVFGVAGGVSGGPLPTLAPPNEPLTLEQLREMDGEPVYIVFLPDVDGERLQFWALVSVDEWGEVYLMNNLGGSSTYEEAWADIEAIYRRPPEEGNT